YIPGFGGDHDVGRRGENVPVLGTEDSDFRRLIVGRAGVVVMDKGSSAAVKADAVAIGRHRKNIETARRLESDDDCFRAFDETVIDWHHDDPRFGGALFDEDTAGEFAVIDAVVGGTIEVVEDEEGTIRWVGPAHVEGRSVDDVVAAAA